jgi:cAMP-dependent protein kinase regulator
MDRLRELKDRGTSLLVMGKLPAALEEFKKAVALDPQDLVARRKVAEVFARMGRIDDAIHAYQGLAGRYAVSGKILEAIAVGKVILQLDPNHKQTQQALAQFALRRKKEEEWEARLPDTMTALIEQERLREVPPPSPPEPSHDVAVTGGLREPFPELPRAVMVKLLQRLSLRSAGQGEAIIVEGERGTSMFVLVSGVVKVVRKGREPLVVDELHEGAIFGEIAMLTDVPRMASVVASEECMLLEVPRALLDELATEHPSFREVLDRYFKERLLANLLRSSELFRSFSGDALERLVERFELRTCQRGDELVRQGDNGRGLWVILRGRCVAYDVPTGEEYPELSEGAVFGEISLLELCPATATVRAETQCVLLFLDRRAFADELLVNADAARKLEGIARERLERSAKLLADGIAMLPSLL